MAGKQFQFYLDIICNLDKFYMVLIKFVYSTVKLHEGQNFVPCIRSGNKRGTKSGKIDTMLYYSCVFNVVIINIIEIG